MPGAAARRGEADAQPLVVFLMCALMVAAVGWLVWGDGGTVAPVAAPSAMDASGERVARQAAEAARQPDQGPGGRATVDVDAAGDVTTSVVDEDPAAREVIALHGIVVDGSDQPVAGARVAVFQDHMATYARWFELGPEEVEIFDMVEEDGVIEFGEERESDVSFEEIGAADEAPTEPLWASIEADAGGRFVLELPGDVFARSPLIGARAEGLLDSALVPVVDDHFQVLRLESPASVRLPVRMPPRLEDDHRAVLHVEREGRRVLSTAVWAFAREEVPELADLEPGAYRFVIEVGCAYWPVYEAEFDLVPGEVRHLDEARLDETVARVEVELRAANGAALADAEVALWTRGGGPSKAAGASGAAVVDGGSSNAGFGQSATDGPAIDSASATAIDPASVTTNDRANAPAEAFDAAACTGLRTDALGRIWLTVPLAELPLTLAVTSGADAQAGSLTAAHASTPGLHVLTLAP